MAVREADAQRAVTDDFGERQLRRFDVEVAFDDLEVGGDGAQEVVGFFRRQVAEAEGLADFAGGEEFLELWFGYVGEWGVEREGGEGCTFAGMSWAKGWVSFCGLRG